MEATNNKRNKVTDELVLSMLIDIEQEIKTNSINYKKLAEKHKGTVYSILAVLRKTEVIIKAGNNIIWNSHSPDITMAKEVREEYNKSTKISHKKYLKNKDLIAEHKKHLESIRVAEEVEEIITDPLNFEVPLNAFEDLGSTKNDADITISYLKLENKELKSEIDGKNKLIKDIIRQIETLRNTNDKCEKELKILKDKKNVNAEDLQKYEFKIFNLETELLHLKKGKKPIRLFGIKIGSIG